jgi:hypothetical protein
MRGITRSIFDSASSEIARLLDAGHASALEDEGILSFLEIRAAREDIDELRKRLQDLLEWITSREDAKDAEAVERYSMTLAFYPFDLPPRNVGKG